jgi:hypothetical protein
MIESYAHWITNDFVDLKLFLMICLIKGLLCGWLNIQNESSLLLGRS